MLAGGEKPGGRGEADEGHDDFVGADLDGEAEGDTKAEGDDGEDFGEETVGDAHEDAEGEVNDERDPVGCGVVGEERDEDLGLRDAAGGARRPGDFPAELEEAGDEAGDGTGEESRGGAAGGARSGGEEVGHVGLLGAAVAFG